MNRNTIIYLLIALVVLIGVYFVISSPKEVTAPATTDDQTSEENLPKDKQADMNMDMSEETSVQTEPGDTTVPGGHDVGMEFPEPDVSLDSSVSIDAPVEATGEEVSFNIDAFNFGYSQETLRVKKGDTVTITLTSTDGFHDWVVDEFGAETSKIRDGETTSVTFVADQTGEFEYYCSVGSHRQMGMVGTLIVE